MLIFYHFSDLVMPETHPFVVKEEQRKPFLRMAGGEARRGSWGFCTGRAWLCSAVPTLLAHRYMAESPGSRRLIFR